MKKILVVDDDADIREAIIAVLSKEYECKEADGGASARNALSTFAPDLLILDVMMESMSTGFDLARQVRKQSPLSKILMLTGVDKEVNIDFKSEAGNPDWLPVDAYLSKPVVPKVLAEKVKALIG
jgi:DNA-binding response OmpR family regulator